MMPEYSSHGNGRARKGLTIVIPAHNESTRIVPTLEAYTAFFRNRATFIVVANGCTDGTFDVVYRFAQSAPCEITVLNEPKPIGKGGALRMGFRQADADIIGFIDADGATTPQEFDRLCSFIGQYDVVFGSRWMKGARVYNRTSVLRKIASSLFVGLTRLLFLMPFHDTQCGVKIFTQKVIRDIVPRLRTSDASIDVELLYRAYARGYSLHEEPTEWTDKKSSVFTSRPLSFITTSLSMIRSLIFLRFHLLKSSSL